MLGKVPQRRALKGASKWDTGSWRASLTGYQGEKVGPSMPSCTPSATLFQAADSCRRA